MRLSQVLTGTAATPPGEPGDLHRGSLGFTLCEACVTGLTGLVMDFELVHFEIEGAGGDTLEILLMRRHKRG